ncbi:MAG: aminotransferase class I/II-fold pyridoxal phosphate-dependent enzyme [Aristaeellaceae bacterium]
MKHPDYIVREYGYEYDAEVDLTILDKVGTASTNQPYQGALALRCGRDCLKVIAQAYHDAVVLIPALACNSMFTPFEGYGHEVRFYPYEPSFHIQMDALMQLIPQNGQRVLFLYMDYFGNPAITDEELLQLRTRYPQMVFIEDRTHDLLVEQHRTFCPDYTLASLRKWLNIPDGGLLWGEVHPQTIEENTTFSQARLRAQCLRNQFFRSGDEAVKREYRGIFSRLDELIDNREPYRMSAYARALADRADWNAIRLQRQKNAEVLLRTLMHNPHIRFVQPEAGRSDLYVELLVEQRDEIQRRLSAKSVFCTIIWPLCEAQRKACCWSQYVETHMLAAPCDQRYDEEDMQYIACEIDRVVNEVLGKVERP